VSMRKSTAYRLAAGLAIAGTAALVWLSLGVGIIGADGDRANLMYFGVIAVGVIGAVVARLRPDAMADALFTMALAQTLVLMIALVAGMGRPWSPPLELILLNGMFVALFVASGLLFEHAARPNPSTSVAPSR